MRENPNFIAWLGLKDYKFNKFEDLLKYQKEPIIFRKIKKLFSIFGAYFNFLKYCEDEKIIKKQEFFLDLFSRPLEWLFHEGANILMIQL